MQASCSIFGSFLRPYTPGFGYPHMGPRPNTPRGFHQLWLITRTPIPCSPPHGTRVFYYTDCACAVFAFAGGRATHLGHARSGAALPEGHVTVHIFCSFCSNPIVDFFRMHTFSAVFSLVGLLQCFFAQLSVCIVQHFWLFFEALHAWTCTTGWQRYPRMRPRI